MDATTAITMAFIGMGGVFVGALVTAGANWLFAIRREKVDAEKGRRMHAIEVKKASRLIADELSIAQAAAQKCVEQKHWWGADVQLTTEAWQKYRSVITPELSDTDWNTLVAAFQAVDDLRIIGSFRTDTELIPHTTADQISPILRDIRKGLDAVVALLDQNSPWRADA
jgi:hypothetical protein